VTLVQQELRVLKERLVHKVLQDLQDLQVVLVLKVLKVLLVVLEDKVRKGLLELKGPKVLKEAKVLMELTDHLDLLVHKVLRDLVRVLKVLKV
jgi:hypothetical protein